MKHFKSKFILLALALSLLLTFSACGNQNAAKASDSVFSTMETTDLEGNTVNASVFTENKLTIVNVWNVGCTPCINEIPALDKINKEYADQGVAVMGLYYNMGETPADNTREEIKAILTDAAATYPHLLISPDMEESETIQNITAFPTTFFVDAEGNIIDTVIGAHDYESWKGVIDNMLKQVDGNA